jgi:2-oxoglutarate dehydrogenase complex dehydrogenase (E1) component-like enzyme
MLRASKIFSSLQQTSSLSRQLNSVLKSQSNSYHYQAEIYTNNFENSELKKELKSDLLKLNRHRIDQPNLYRFIKSYQEHGYKIANLNPLKTSTNEINITELEPEFYGLSRNDTKYSVDGLLNANGSASMTVNEIENYLKKIYSQQITIEFEFLQSEEEKLWLAR